MATSRATGPLAGLAAVLGLLCATATPSHASVELSGADLRTDGGAAGDEAGLAVAAAGDVNGDGKQDVLIGAPLAGSGGANSGSVYLILGGNRGTLDLGALPATGVRGDGLAGDELGWSVAPAGDVNGDGLADILVGAPFADNNSRADSGSAYVFFGSRTPAEILSRSLRVDGEQTGDMAGYSVASAGDFNGDGKPDLVIGAPNAAGGGVTRQGAAYVVFGGRDAGVVDLANLGSAGVRISDSGSGGVATDRAGAAVAGGASVNGDSFSDVVIGAPDAGSNARLTSGSAYVVYGSATPTPVDMQSLNSSPGRGYRIDGAVGGGATSHGDGAGSSLATADANGDGTGDVIVGAPFADNNNRKNSGSAYVIYGGTGPRSTVDLGLLGTGGFRVDGGPDQQSPGGDNLGTSVAAVDLNGDGVAELIAGAPGADNNGRADAGSTYQITGGPAKPATIDVSASSQPPEVLITRFDGQAAGDLSGTSVAGAPAGGGVGGGTLIGAPLAGNNSRASSGSAYEVFDTRELAVSMAGTGSGYIDSSPPGIDCGGAAHPDCRETFDDGTRVTLTAHPDPASDFAGFSGGGCSGSGLTCEVTMDQARAVTATFTLKPHRQLTVSMAGAGTGSVSSSPAAISCLPTCSADFLEGATVTLTAHPDPASDFVGFSGGGCSGSGLTCQVTMDQPRSVSASFTPKPQHLLTVAMAGSGSGSVSSTPAGISCPSTCASSFVEGAAVTLVAHPDPTSDFAGFSGDGCSGAQPTCVVTIDQARAVTATFTRKIGPPADRTPPTVSLGKRPRKRSRSRTARFTFLGSEPGSRVECALDRRPFRPCASPLRLKRLKPGVHRLRVRAIDPAGNVGPPTVARWRVVPK